MLFINTSSRRSTASSSSSSSASSSPSSSASTSTSTLVSNASIPKSFSDSTPAFNPTLQSEDRFNATAVGREAEMMDDDDQAWGPAPRTRKMTLTSSRLSFFQRQQQPSRS